jgi:hypothetical protein
MMSEQELKPDALEPDNLDDGADEQEPDEGSLPSKPVIAGMPTDEEVEAEPEPGEEEVPDEDFVEAKDARENDEIDDEEFDSG